MELYLSTMIRQIDSSLLDEWEKLRDPNYQRAETKEARPPGAEQADKDITRDVKAFTAAIRQKIFSFLRGLVIGDFDAALSTLSNANDPDGQPWTAERLRQALDAFHAEHEYIRLDPEARNNRHTYVIPAEDRKTWRAQQMLIDPQEQNDWAVEFVIDIEASRQAGEPALRLNTISQL